MLGELFGEPGEGTRGREEGGGGDGEIEGGEEGRGEREGRKRVASELQEGGRGGGNGRRRGSKKIEGFSPKIVKFFLRGKGEG